MGAACASALIVSLPAIDKAHEEQRNEASLKLKVMALATHQDGAAAARSLTDAPDLLQHPWLVQMEGNLENRAMAALTQASAHDRDMMALSTMAKFESRHIEKAETLATETQCMAEAVYYEARSESLSGQLAVAEVVSNRVTDHRYPNSVCDVVYQGATRTTGCQFTFTCDGSMDKAPRGERWEQAKQVAAHVLLDLHEPRTKAATHYHADYVDPVWNSGLVKTEKIDTHIFYRFPRGTEWAAARERQNARMAAVHRNRIQTVSAQAPKPSVPSTLSAYASAQIVKASGPMATIKPAPAAGTADDLNTISLQTLESPAAP
ncbi:MAG: cell wall hydrolase [Pseudomonadota bacterium]